WAEPPVDSAVVNAGSERAPQHTEPAAVVPELRVLAAQSLREYRWGQLMRALWLSGAPAEALGCYGRLRAAMAQRYGAEPGPHLRELRDRIRAGERGRTTTGVR
uniref:AfsR/SARP family transcriptional regulator n=1 Tax=Streptomyces bohaiensis TaxID=1431344 RepID=UPI0030C68373